MTRKEIEVVIVFLIIVLIMERYYFKKKQQNKQLNTYNYSSPYNYNPYAK